MLMVTNAFLIMLAAGRLAAAGCAGACGAACDCCEQIQVGSATGQPVRTICHTSTRWLSYECISGQCQTEFTGLTWLLAALGSLAFVAACFCLCGMVHACLERNHPAALRPDNAQVTRAALQIALADIESEKTSSGDTFG